jgi:hypothetical protein
MTAQNSRIVTLLHGAGVAGLALVLLFLTHYAQADETNPASTPSTSPTSELLDAATLGSCEGFTAQPGVRSVHPCGDSYNAHGQRIFDKLGRPIAEKPNLPAPGDSLIFHVNSIHPIPAPSPRHWSLLSFSAHQPLSDITHPAVTIAYLPTYAVAPQNMSYALITPMPRVTSWLTSVAHAAGISGDYSISSNTGLIRAGDGSAYQPTYSTWATAGFGSGHTHIYGGLVAQTMMIVHRSSLDMNWGTSYGLGGGLQFILGHKQ